MHWRGLSVGRGRRWVSDRSGSWLVAAVITLFALSRTTRANCAAGTVDVGTVSSRSRFGG
jgi:hypothetical protein